MAWWWWWRWCVLTNVVFSWLTAALVSVREGREGSTRELVFCSSSFTFLFWNLLHSFFRTLSFNLTILVLLKWNIFESLFLSFFVVLFLKHAVWGYSLRAITMMIKATLVDKEIWWCWWWWRYSQFWEVPLVVSHASRLKNCMLIIISIFSFILTFNIIVIITSIGMIITMMILTIYVIIIILAMMIMIIVSYSGRTIIANSISNMAEFAL